MGAKTYLLYLKKKYCGHMESSDAYDSVTCLSKTWTSQSADANVQVILSITSFWPFQETCVFWLHQYQGFKCWPVQIYTSHWILKYPKCLISVFYYQYWFCWHVLYCIADFDITSDWPVLIRIFKPWSTFFAVEIMVFGLLYSYFLDLDCAKWIISEFAYFLSIY